MKLTLLFLLTMMSVMHANDSYSQKTKLSLNVNNMEISEVIEKIETATDFRFVYNIKSVDLNRTISLKVKDEKIESVLKLIFKNTTTGFKITGTHIVLIPKSLDTSQILPLQENAPINIKGKITDEKGNPLIGASVTNKTTGIGVITDANGEYEIDTNQNDVLIISFLGFKTVEINIKQNKTVNITLKEDEISLQDVTVNAGYYKVKEKESTGSISRITSKEIENQPVTNVLATMQGRMAGVDVTQDSGSPGGAFSIKIRGQNSLRDDGNQPLYVIDGVPYSSETIGSISTSGTAPSLTTPLNSINPLNIESIEVLKDADATAIYGSRGANGVVLITTKKGKSGKTSFTLNTSSSFGTASVRPRLMNTEQYLAMRKQAYANDGVEIPSYAYDVNGTWSPDRYTDWQEELIGGTAEIYTVQGTVSGGSEKTQYLMSGTYRTETTVFPGDFKYTKGSGLFSMNHTSDDDRFKITFSGNYASQINNQPSDDLTAISRTLAPNAPAIYDSEGNLNWENGTWDNPLARMESEFESRINDFGANSVLSYQLLQNLEIKTSFGFTDLQNNETRTQPSTMYNPAYGLGSEFSSLDSSITGRSSWIVEPQINYNTTIGKGNISALLGGTLLSQRTDRMQQFGFGFASNSLIHDLASASFKSISLSDVTIYKYQALFTRLNYNWDNRYIINLTGRRDGSSRFGSGKQFALFGAVGAAWLFSNETFLKDSNILSFGKLRSSYGTTGNDQIGDYQFLDTYVSSGNIYQGIIGLQPTRLFNPDFGWETNKKFEIALETGFLKDRIFLISAYYNNKSSNQLVGIPLPGTTGFNSLYANLDATVQNSGLEFTLNTVNITNKNFEWTTNFNISFNRNKLISYPGLESSSNANRYIIGQPTSIRKLYNYTGMNDATGVYEFEDMNGDGVLNSIDDRQTIVTLYPAYFGGLGNQLKYKQLRLDFFFQFVKQQAFSYQPGVPGTPVNQLASVSDVTSQQPYTAGSNGDVINAYYRFASSDGALEDASYIRLKNISLSYDLPLNPNVPVDCQLYMQGQNVMTFTNYKNWDPELKFGGYLPPLRVFAFGVKLTF